jgi:hypothetical protein
MQTQNTSKITIAVRYGQEKVPTIDRCAHSVGIVSLHEFGVACGSGVIAFAIVVSLRGRLFFAVILPSVWYMIGYMRFRWRVRGVMSDKRKGLHAGP